MEVGSIRRIQGFGYGVLEFLGIGTTLDIFQNIHILYPEYGVLSFSRYGVLNLFPLWSLGISHEKDSDSSEGKKRKISECEVTEMVKNGKLTRKGGTVTYCKCGQKGHDKRSCKGLSVAGSGAANGAASVSKTPRQRQASTSNPVSAPNLQGHHKYLQVPLQVDPNHKDNPKELQLKLQVPL
ncbi:hypothetical protein Tco_0177924 [Tanacetum coccineum]